MGRVNWGCQLVGCQCLGHLVSPRDDKQGLVPNTATLVISKSLSTNGIENRRRKSTDGVSAWGEILAPSCVA